MNGKKSPGRACQHCDYIYLTKTHNWVEWTAASITLSQTKGNDINLNDRNQMQNDTENEIGRSLFQFIHGVRIVIGFDL